MKGRLQDMAVADLVQHACQDRKTARVELKKGWLKAELFFKNGNVVHAAMGGKAGEAVFYELFDWDAGTFELKADVDPPEISITRNWTSLLLEAARLADEASGRFRADAAGYRARRDLLDRNAVAGTESVSRQESAGFEVFGVAGATAAAPGSAESASKDLVAVSPQELIDDLSSQVEGHQLTCLTQMRGEGLYWSASSKVELEEMVEQVNQFVKLVNTVSQRLSPTSLEDNLLSTETAYLLVRLLGLDSYYLLVAADKQKANLGSMRHLSGVFADRLRKTLETRSG